MRRRPRLPQYAARLALAAVLLLPLVSRLHAHLDSTSADACAVCVVAHHAPLAPVVAPLVVAATGQFFRLPAAAPIVPTRFAGGRHTGRAPPDPSRVALG